MTSRPWRAGIDIGGTFTDFVLSHRSEGVASLNKRLTTPADPSVAAVEGLVDLCAKRSLTLEDLDEVVHGTTLVTNAVIERRGARTALITTAGFRDLLEMGTEQRYDIYDLTLKFPPALVPRHLRLEVSERMGSDGDVVVQLDEGQVAGIVDTLRAEHVEAVAICLLHAYRNSDHERRLRDLLVASCPDLAISLSCEVAPEIGEYPRLVTTCANAYCQPMMARYLALMESRLAERGFSGRLWLTQSTGDLANLQLARRFPIRFLESGPAGGARAAAHVARTTGRHRLLAFDMGGTTAKGCVIDDGAPRLVHEMETAREHRFVAGSGLPVRSPVIDMIEIGAGGGSIAAIDDLGLLKVGPRSAGSNPGPACYANGGEAPTVTDANLVLGRLDLDNFLGGAMPLDAQAARQALTTLAERLSMTAEQAAHGIFSIVNDSMAAALREYATERGLDPRDFSLVAFGGAGPSHAAAMGRILGIGEVIVPPLSGAASAFGFLDCPLAFERTRSWPVTVTKGWDAAAAADVLQTLVDETRVMIAETGVPPQTITVHRSCDMRLKGQRHVIQVANARALTEAGAADDLRRQFLDAYRERHGFVADDVPVEIVNLRVRVAGARAPLPLSRAAPEAGQTGPARSRKVYAGADGWQTATVHDRALLHVGQYIEGPALIQEREATTFVPAGDTMTVDANGNLVITVAAPARMEIATSTDDLDAQAGRIRSDPVGFEIMWSRLAAICDEMWNSISRTAFSLIVSEAKDFACELLDASGETLAHCRRGMPVFNLTMPIAVKALLERFPPETLRPGDVLITNDPWLCAGHLPDVAVVTPIFVDERLVALAGTVGHVSDIGGTQDGLSARELHDEGILIPPIKLIAAGEVDQTLLAMIEHNVRGGKQVVGDLMAFVGGNALGARRLEALIREYGLGDLRPLASLVQSHSEAAMRRAIEALPDGVYTGQSLFNPLGESLTITAQVRITGADVEIAFLNPPPVFERGGLNCTLSYTMAHATYTFKCLLTPQVRGNAGCYRPFRVLAPEPSALNAPRGASVNLRTRTGWYIGPAVYQALSAILPDRVPAPSGLPMSITVHGANAQGSYSDLFLLGGGQGASTGTDGYSALIYPSSAANTSVEVFETRVPALIHEKSFIADSGGRGRHRGGLAQRIVLGKRFDDREPMHVSLYPEAVGLPAAGLFGGEAGSVARGTVLEGGGAGAGHDCGTGALVTLRSRDTRIEACLTGGAGHGVPDERSPDRDSADLRDGYVTANATHGRPVAERRRIEEEVS